MKSPNSRYLWWIRKLSLFALAVAASLVQVDEALAQHSAPVAAIPPGTVVQDQAPEGWTHLILLAKPRVAAGDVDAVPAMFKRYASTFSLVILANVVSETAVGSNRYRLDKVAIGNCMAINGRNVVVNSATHKELGAKLDFVSQRILAGTEKNLRLAEEVARSDAISIFDAHAIMHWDGSHRPMVVRHMVWISPETGQLGTLAWLLDRDGDNYRLAERFLRALPRDFVEDRVFRVDSSKVIFGIPADDAIALNAMPAGTKIPATGELASLVAHRRYDEVALGKLAVELNVALRQVRVAEKAE